jgi:hypothetical protein
MSSSAAQAAAVEVGRRHWQGRVIPFSEVVRTLAHGSLEYKQLEERVDALLDEPPLALILATPRRALVSFAAAPRHAYGWGDDGMERRALRKLHLEPGAAAPITRIGRAPLRAQLSRHPLINRLMSDMCDVFAVAQAEAATDPEVQRLEHLLVQVSEELDRLTTLEHDREAQEMLTTYETTERRRNARWALAVSRPRDRLLALERSPVHGL